jgi:hypothetical protein
MVDSISSCCYCYYGLNPHTLKRRKMNLEENRHRKADRIGITAWRMGITPSEFNRDQIKQCKAVISTPKPGNKEIYTKLSDESIAEVQFTIESLMELIGNPADFGLALPLPKR